MTGRRHLPVLQAAGVAGDAADADPKRPAWQWAAFGSMLMLAAWAVLAGFCAVLFTIWTENRFIPGDHEPTAMSTLVFAAANAAVYFVSIAAGAYVVGRWGGSGVGHRTTLGSALLTIGAASALALRELEGSFVLKASTFLLLLSAAAAPLGTHVGKKAKS